MLKYLLEKEFKQILRNKFLSKLIVVLPLMTIVVFPYVTNQEVADVKLAVVDHDHTTSSVRLVQKAAQSGYFRLAVAAPAYGEALHEVEKGDADLILEIPPDFERDLQHGGMARVTAPMEVKDLKLELTGKSQATLNGTARYLSLFLSSGTLDAVRLEVMSAEVNVTSSGSASLWVTDRFEGKTSTGGKITYKGTPTVIRGGMKFMGGDITRTGE